LTKKVRKLKGVHFDFAGAHLAYTDESQGGAASLMNDPLLLKAQELDIPLTENQKKILEDINEESLPLDKSKSNSSDNTPSSSEETGEDTINKKGTDNDMSEEILKKLASVEHELAVAKAEKQVSPYSFGELETGVATALANASKEDSEAITKAFTYLKECGDYGVAVEKANVVKVDPDNALAKALDEEAGAEGDGGEELSNADQKNADLKKALDAEYEKLNKGGKA
jgi:hypothetical protein